MECSRSIEVGASTTEKVSQKHYLTLAINTRLTVRF